MAQVCKTYTRHKMVGHESCLIEKKVARRGDRVIVYICHFNSGDSMRPSFFEVT